MQAAEVEVFQSSSDESERCMENQLKRCKILSLKPDIIPCRMIDLKRRIFFAGSATAYVIYDSFTAEEILKTETAGAKSKIHIF